MRISDASRPQCRLVTPRATPSARLIAYWVRRKAWKPSNTVSHASCVLPRRQRMRDAHGRSNILRPLQSRFKARKKPEGYTSTPTGLKRLKTQNTAFHGNANGKGTPSGVPQPIHKRKLILVKEEFDASSSGGGAENRTPVQSKPPKGVSRLSCRLGLGRRAPVNPRLATQLVRSFCSAYQPRPSKHLPKMTSPRERERSPH